MMQRGTETEKKFDQSAEFYRNWKMSEVLVVKGFTIICSVHPRVLELALFVTISENYSIK